MAHLTLGEMHSICVKQLDSCFSSTILRLLERVLGVESHWLWSPWTIISWKSSFPSPLLRLYFLSSQDHLTRQSFHRSRSMTRWSSKAVLVKKEFSTSRKLRMSMNTRNSSRHRFWGAPLKERWRACTAFQLVPTQPHILHTHILFIACCLFKTQQCHCSDGNFTAKGNCHIPPLELAVVQISKPRARFFHWSFSSGSTLTSRVAYPQMCQAIIKSPVTQDLLQTRQRYCKGRQNRYPANTRNHVVFTGALSFVPATQLEQLQAFWVHTGLTPDSTTM